MGDQKVWFVTGASKGLGLSLVKKLLKAGNKVAATSRNTAELIEAVGFDGDSFLPLEVDLADDASVCDAIDKTTHVFKRIDVIVNNAGYGIGGSIEELSDKETRDSFDINVFGTLNVIRSVMPQLRKQQSGHIINISSIAGIAPAPGWAIYGATKFAVIGISEVLAADVKSFGVKVTVIAPGAFRTSFLADESLVLAKHPIDAYEDVRASHAKYKKMDGAQAGDPEKAANVMIALADMPEPPVQLLLGSDAYNRALVKIEALNDSYRNSEALTKSTDY